MTELLFQNQTFEIIGACMKIHSALGCGYKEAIYQDALEVELSNRNFPLLEKKSLKLYTKALFLSIILWLILLFTRK